MRLEIVDTKATARELVQIQKAARRRLRSDAGIRKALPPAIPVTKISWTFGNTTVTGNVIAYDFSAVTVAQVIAAVCEFYEVSQMDLVSDRRTARVVYPRHIAMYLARELTPKSFPLIGRMMGGRDHTTALHGWRRIKAMLETDERMADEIEILMRKIMP